MPCRAARSRCRSRPCFQGAGRPAGYCADTARRPTDSPARAGYPARCPTAQPRRAACACARAAQRRTIRALAAHAKIWLSPARRWTRTLVLTARGSTLRAGIADRNRHLSRVPLAPATLKHRSRHCFGATGPLPPPVLGVTGAVPAGPPTPGSPRWHAGAVERLVGALVAGRAVDLRRVAQRPEPVVREGRLAAAPGSSRSGRGPCGCRTRPWSACRRALVPGA